MDSVTPLGGVLHSLHRSHPPPLRLLFCTVYPFSLPAHLHSQCLLSPSCSPMGSVLHSRWFDMGFVLTSFSARWAQLWVPFTGLPFSSSAPTPLSLTFRLFHFLSGLLLEQENIFLQLLLGQSAFITPPVPGLFRSVLLSFFIFLSLCFLSSVSLSPATSSICEPLAPPFTHIILWGVRVHAV